LVNPLIISLIIGLCFFFSGSAGLILEIVWTKYLNLIFGSTTLSISTTVAAFMGGLAIGSYYADKLLKRLKSPVFSYGLFEIFIGVYALIIPLILNWFVKIQGDILSIFYEKAIVYSLVRFVFCFLVLILPTTAMGATLPILSRYLINNIREGGSKMGILYSLNTAGATAGTLIAGFYLIRLFGISNTNYIAASIDISVGITMLIASRFLGAGNIYKDETEFRGVSLSNADSTGVEWILIFVSFVAGLVSMCYQMLWTRSLSMVIGSSTYAFTIILVTFLLGISTGSIMYSRIINRREDSISDLIYIFMGIGFSALFTSLYIDRLPFLVQKIMLTENFSPSHIFWGYFFITSIVVIIPTILMGMYIPLLVHIALRDIESVTADIGRIYSANTIGNIIGSFLGGFVIIPLIGIQTGIRISVLISIALSLILILYFKRVYTPSGLRATIISISVIVFTLIIPGWDIAKWSSGMFRAYLARGPYSRGEYIPPNVIFHKDGIVTTVTVEYRDGGMYSLKVNGKVDASNGSDMSTQMLSGIIPMLFNPDAKSVAIIGFGSGTTSGTASRTDVEEVISIELEEAVIEASKHFTGFNLEPLKSPKHRVRIDDGRNYIISTKRKFDVIISEPSNPWMSGASSLFTYDFWKTASTRLNENGIFCQWLQMYELSLENIKILMNTFHKVFPYVILFQSYQNSNDTLLIGSFKPLKFNYERAKGLINREGLREELKRINVTDPFDILILIYYTRQEIEQFATTDRINTDDNSIIEFSAPIDLLMYAVQKEDKPPPPLLKDGVIDRILSMMEDRERFDRGVLMEALAESALKRGKLKSARRAASEIVDENARKLFLKIVDYMEGAEYVFPFRIIGKNVLGDRWGYFVQLLRQENIPSAINLINSKPPEPIYRRICSTLVEIYVPPTSSIEEELLMGYLYFYDNSYYHAIYLWEKAISKGADQKYPWIYYYIGRAYYHLDEYADSFYALKRFVEWDTDNFLEKEAGNSSE